MTFEIVVNPAGAGGRGKGTWESLEPMFQGTEYNVHYSSEDRSIREIVHDLTSQGRPVNLVILGGDGSMNEAVNGIADFSLVRLGLIPSGSANDLAKDIGVAPTAEEQVARILRGEAVRSIDVGEVILHNWQDPDNGLGPTEGEQRMRFNVSCGVGWDAEICYWADHSPMKKTLNRLRLGKLIYIAEAIRTVFGMDPFECRVNAGDQTGVLDKCVFCAVMNHRFEGGGFMFGPHAKNDDRILDMCAVNDISVPAFFMMFPKAYQGKHFESDYAYEVRAEEFRFQTAKPVFVHTDGEVRWLSSDISVHLLEEKLCLLF